MDYLQQIINKEYYNFYKEDKIRGFLNLYELVISKEANQKIYRNHKKRILDMISILKEDIRNIWEDKNKDYITKRADIYNIKLEVENKTNRWNINEAIKLELVKESDNNKLLFKILMMNNEFIRLFFENIA